MPVLFPQWFTSVQVRFDTLFKHALQARQNQSGVHVFTAGGVIITCEGGLDGGVGGGVGGGDGVVGGVYITDGVTQTLFTHICPDEHEIVLYAQPVGVGGVGDGPGGGAYWYMPNPENEVTFTSKYSPVVLR